MVATKKHNVLVGCHTSISGGLHKAIERGEAIGCTAIQIFTKSSRKWFDGKITEEEAEFFKQTWKQSTIEKVITHSGYLINVGSPTKKTATDSTKSLTDEIKRCAMLGIPNLIIHPGSHLKKGEDECLTRIAENIDYALDQCDGSVCVLLETMAGQGSNVGYTFQQLLEIRKRSTHKKNIGYCLDTCHIFSAGYDISSEAAYKKTFKLFDDILGLEHLHAIHVNDSQTPFNSRKDRHAALGEGSIPLETFKLLMQDKKLCDIPKLLETPTDPEMKLWKKEIALLKKFAE